MHWQYPARAYATVFETSDAGTRRSITHLAAQGIELVRLHIVDFTIQSGLIGPREIVAGKSETRRLGHPLEPGWKGTERWQWGVVVATGRAGC